MLFDNPVMVPNFEPGRLVVVSPSGGAAGWSAHYFENVRVSADLASRVSVQPSGGVGRGDVSRVVGAAAAEARESSPA